MYNVVFSFHNNVQGKGVQEKVALRMMSQQRVPSNETRKSMYEAFSAVLNVLTSKELNSFFVLW